MEQSTAKELEAEYVKELEQMRFQFLDKIIFVHSYVPLSDDRIEVWRKWLEKNYPSKRVVFI